MVFMWVMVGHGVHVGDGAMVFMWVMVGHGVVWVMGGA